MKLLDYGDSLVGKTIIKETYIGQCLDTDFMDYKALIFSDGTARVTETEEGYPGTTTSDVVTEVSSKIKVLLELMTEEEYQEELLRVANNKKFNKEFEE